MEQSSIKKIDKIQSVIESAQKMVMNLNARNEHTVKDTLKLLEARRASGEYASN